MQDAVGAPPRDLVECLDAKLLAGVAATTTLSWIYATTTWAVTVTASGAEVIEEVAEAMKQLVSRAGWVGEQTLDTYGKFLDKVITQTGDVVCWLIIVLAAVVGKTIVCDYYRRRGPDGGLSLIHI